MLDKIISYSFYLLFFLTPLFWTSLNHELFEYNKMILVYGFTVIIVGTWILKSINEKVFTIKRTPLDIPLLLFLGANILSTIFSIDTHTSIWGYYSRSNGGLLSIISYLLLYSAFVSNIKKEQISTLLKFGLASGLIVSLWGIFEHFGVSPSCIILRGQFNADCWVQDVQVRVFASLGQPNWMAAYLSMLIFPLLYFLLTAKTQKSIVTCYMLLVTFYLAFTFTYSRGPTLGLIGGMAIFLLLSFLLASRSERKRESIQSGSWGPKSRMTIVITSFLTINILFGSALTSFRLVSKFAPPARPSISLPSAPTSGTQLENGGTESGQIRFIVWLGALDIFKAYPILGSGVETFAYSYYQFRPISHNLTSEWDFLYNKAHNEYLNYLSTTGAVGLGTYMLVMGTFLVWCIKYLVIARNQVTKQSVSLARSPRPFGARDDVLLVVALLASYISYLIYNFFLFSVVIIAVFFYLFPAITFVLTDSLKGYGLRFTGNRWIRLIVLLSTIYILYSIIQLWYADTLFARGQKEADRGNLVEAYNLLFSASSLNPIEPLYRSELASVAATTATALDTISSDEATLSARLKNEAVFETQTILRSNPKNISFWKSAVTTYFELSSLDKKYIEDTLKAADKAISLSPTDPKLYYTKSLILKAMGKKEEAIEQLKKALELKPNYVDAKTELEDSDEIH